MKFYQELVLPLIRGGANTGTVLGKLNALFSAGGGISGFKYTQKTDSFTYTTTSSGICVGEIRGGYANREPSLTITNGYLLTFVMKGYESFEVADKFIGFFTKNANIKGVIDDNGDVIKVNFFEFI